MTNPTDSETTTATMRAVVQDRYGSSEVLRLARVARPVIADDQVLLHVSAAGLDRGTEHLMTGKPYVARLFVGLRKPKNPIPGRDAAGTVAAVGSSVTPVRDRRRGVRGGSRVLRRVRRGARGQARPQAREPVLRPGRGDSRVGRHGAAGARRRRASAGRSVGAGGRRVRRRRHLRGPAGEGVRRRGHRSFEHREGGPGEVPGRRPRHRLHPRRLRRRDSPLRPDPRHRRKHPGAAAAASPSTARHARVRRW